MGQSLQFCFHDPNPAAITADFLLRLLVQANQPRLEALLRQAAADLTPASPAPGRDGCCP